MCGSKLYGKGDLERERERECYARVGLYYTYEWEDVTNYNQTSDMWRLCTQNIDYHLD